jgi:hypothetical protein
MTTIPNPFVPINPSQREGCSSHYSHERGKTASSQNPGDFAEQRFSSRRTRSPASACVIVAAFAHVTTGAGTWVRLTVGACRACAELGAVEHRVGRGKSLGPRPVNRTRANFFLRDWEA